jgi:UDP-2-acetamido-3-amino-2,3-dideoxy-glucuronate N-acetyltransferase
MLSRSRAIDLPNIIDLRGKLTVCEFGTHIPFEVKRCFMVYQVPLLETRGEHAHKQCHQFLMCVRGRMLVTVDDGEGRQEFNLDGPYRGLYMPPMVWGIQHSYSPEAFLVVFASHYYDPEDYIRNYDEFRALVKERG